MAKRRRKSGKRRRARKTTSNPPVRRRRRRHAAAAAPRRRRRRHVANPHNRRRRARRTSSFRRRTSRRNPRDNSKSGVMAALVAGGVALGAIALIALLSTAASKPGDFAGQTLKRRVLAVAAGIGGVVLVRKHLPAAGGLVAAALVTGVGPEVTDRAQALGAKAQGMAGVLLSDGRFASPDRIGGRMAGVQLANGQYLTGQRGTMSGADVAPWNQRLGV